MRDADDTFQQFFDCCNIADRFVGKELVGPSHPREVVGETPGRRRVSMRAACFGGHLRPIAALLSADSIHDKHLIFLGNTDLKASTCLRL